MHDFGVFCYLDVPKTGSSFVSRFLRSHCRLEAIEHRKHGRITRPEQLQPEGKLFFISVRDPLEQYKSLYSFGASGRGQLRRSLQRRMGGRVEEMYAGDESGFARWMEFMLDPANAATLGEGFERTHPGEYGFMTHRYLMLAFYQPLATLRGIDPRGALGELHRTRRLHSRILRNESLSDDLAALIETELHPYMRDPAAAIAALGRPQKRINQSERVDRRPGFAVPATILRELEAREWFLLETLGYAASA